jgi:3'(2'), 5'-bisphosphate nucleotidase
VPHQGPRLWVVDPIDGTRGFAKKNGEFSVMVGFVADGLLALGVVLEPAPRRLTYAVRGGGCWRHDGAAPRPEACRVSRTPTLAEAALTQSHSRPGETSRPVRLLRPRAVVESYSAGVKLARVARGEADLYVNTYANFHDWDICAGHILVTEAGGRVSGLRGEEIAYGRPGAWQRGGLLATNGTLHEAALAGLRGTEDEGRAP